jgi:hypothetical protein
VCFVRVQVCKYESKSEYASLCESECASFCMSAVPVSESLGGRMYACMTEQCPTVRHCLTVAAAYVQIHCLPPAGNQF